MMMMYIVSYVHIVSDVCVCALVAGSVIQTIFGHYDVVTCIARSECNVSQDCYVVTGSKDCSVMVWHWSTKQQRILGDNGSKCYACLYVGSRVDIVTSAVYSYNNNNNNNNLRLLRLRQIAQPTMITTTACHAVQQ